MNCGCVGLRCHLLSSGCGSIMQAAPSLSDRSTHERHRVLSRSVCAGVKGSPQHDISQVKTFNTTRPARSAEWLDSPLWAAHSEHEPNMLAPERRP